MNRYEGDRVRVALPGGELQTKVINKLQQRGVKLDSANNKKYLIQATNIPVDLVVVRASAVPELVNCERSHLQGGITGSDILWEAGLGPNAGEELPIDAGSTVFVGVTGRLRRNVGSPVTIDDLAGSMVVTKFPNITEEVFAERGIPIEVFAAAGKTEAMQYVFPNCNGIVDVISSGSTARANDLTVVESILPVTVRLINTNEQLTEREQDILADFRDRMIKT